jgi:hypothetical protein
MRLPKPKTRCKSCKLLYWKKHTCQRKLNSQQNKIEPISFIVKGEQKKTGSADKPKFINIWFNVLLVVSTIYLMIFITMYVGNEISTSEWVETPFMTIPSWIQAIALVTVVGFFSLVVWYINKLNLKSNIKEI